MDPQQVHQAEVPVQLVHDSFRLLQMEMGAQGLVKQIRDFSGEGTKCFQDWIKYNGMI